MILLQTDPSLGNKTLQKALRENTEFKKTIVQLREELQHNEQISQLELIETRKLKIAKHNLQQTKTELQTRLETSQETLKKEQRKANRAIEVIQEEKTKAEQERKRAEQERNRVEQERKRANKAEKALQEEKLKREQAFKKPVDTIHVRKPKPSKGFVLIPAGSFMMGSPKTEKGHQSDEFLHRVKLTRSFYAQQTQVTQAQWKALMGNNPSGFKGNSLPVEQMSWFEACDRRTL